MQEWADETQSSGDSWMEDPDQFSPDPPVRLPIGLSSRITDALTSSADASPPVTPEDALAALRFRPSVYITETPAQTSPTGVILHLANCLEQLLSEQDGRLNKESQLKIAGVLMAAELYADALGQPDTSELLKTLVVDDKEKLLALGGHLTQLGCNLHPSSEGTGELVNAPDLATVLRLHYDRILESDNVTWQMTQAHALAAYLGSTSPGEHEALKLACVDYVRHEAPLQTVVDALFHTIRRLDPSSLSRRQPDDAQKALVERDDVRRNLQLAREELTSASSDHERAKKAANLVHWLQQLSRTESILGHPLERLRDACVACLGPDVGDATTEAMRDALSDCLAAAAIAAGQHNLGPDLSDPAHAEILNQQTRAYAEAIKGAGTAYVMSISRMSTIIEPYLRNPTATIAEVAVQSDASESQVGEVRASLRNRVASSLSDKSLRNLVSCALKSADADEYKKSSTRLLDRRLVNPQAWSAWKEMEKRYNEEFPDPSSKFLDLVEGRDSSLLRFIPVDHAFSGVLYANLFQTSPRYCKSIGDARADLIRVRHAAGLTAPIQVPAAPNA